MVERAGDDGGQVMGRRHLAEATANRGQLAALEQFVSAIASGQFHPWSPKSIKPRGKRTRQGKGDG
jgi:hypothetical protein